MRAFTGMPQAEYAINNPQDPELEKLAARASKERESYFRWGRETLGRAIYMFREMSTPTRDDPR